MPESNEFVKDQIYLRSDTSKSNFFFIHLQILVHSIFIKLRIKSSLQVFKEEYLLANII